MGPFALWIARVVFTPSWLAREASASIYQGSREAHFVNELASQANSYVRPFSSRGIYCIYTSRNWVFNRSYASTYFVICSSLIVKEPYIWDATSCQSKCTWTLVTLTTRVTYNLDRIATYLASLLESLNPSHILIQVSSPEGDTRSIPTPLPSAPANPSTKIYHMNSNPSVTPKSLNSGFDSSDKKSTKACTYIDVIRWYCKSIIFTYLHNPLR